MAAQALKLPRYSPSAKARRGPAAIDREFAEIERILAEAFEASERVAESLASAQRVIGTATSGQVAYWDGPASQTGSANFTFDGTVITINVDVVLSEAIGMIRSNTSDGADSKRIVVNGGGGTTFSVTRGAYAFFAGNEDATNPGGIRLVVGDVSGASIGIGVRDNTATAFFVWDHSNVRYITIDTSNGAEVITFGGSTNPAILFNSTGALGFFAGAGATKQTVTGSRGGNAALASLLTALAAYGQITDSSTA